MEADDRPDVSRLGIPHRDFEQVSSPGAMPGLAPVFKNVSKGIRNTGTPIDKWTEDLYDALTNTG